MREILGDRDRVPAPAFVALASAKSVSKRGRPSSALQRYEVERKNHPDTPDGHAALADWCRKNSLEEKQREHLQHALSLDPEYAPALQALGYVRVGDVWLKRGAKEPQKSRPRIAKRQDEPADPAELLKEAIGKRISQLMAIRGAHLIVGGKLAGDESLRRGMNKIMEFRDPLTIPAVARVLSEPHQVLRQIMVRVLGRLKEDEALMNLVVVALLDPSETVRRDAVLQLVNRKDPRVIEQLREALKSSDEVVLLNAAEALAGLKAREAVPDLAKILMRKKKEPLAKTRLSRKQVLDRITKCFGSEKKVQIGDQEVIYRPEIGVLGPKSPIASVKSRESKSVYRTEVQEALIAITGVNHGFDEEKWMIWHLQNAK